MNLDVITRVAEGKIQEAIEEGKFDNLPGKGKPLVLEEDSSVPLHIRMANRVLKNAGAAPEWIQIRQDILEERAAISRLVQRFARENKNRSQRAGAYDPAHPYHRAYADWHARARAQYLTQLKSVNTSILKFCMCAPSTAEAFTPYNVQKEMAAFDELVPAPSNLPAESSATQEASDSPIRQGAREKYLSRRGR